MIDYRKNDDVCVYVHRRQSDDSVMYVGLSGSRRRPYNFEDRNPLWKNIANKHGVYVEIVAEGLTYEEAAELEIKLIKEYSKVYRLANLTKGGETPLNPLKPRKKPSKRIKHRNKANIPEKRKKAKKQPQSRSNIESVIIAMAEQYPIRKIAKKLSLPVSIVRGVLR